MRDKKKLRERRLVLSKLGFKVQKGRLLRLPDGCYRLRRDKLVRIPDEWVGRPIEMCEKFSGVSSRRWRAYKLKQVRQSKRETRKLRQRSDNVIGRVGRSRRKRDAQGRLVLKSPRIGHPNNRALRHRGGRARQRMDREDGLV